MRGIGLQRTPKLPSSSLFVPFYVQFGVDDGDDRRGVRYGGVGRALGGRVGGGASVEGLVHRPKGGHNPM